MHVHQIINSACVAFVLDHTISERQKKELDVACLAALLAPTLAPNSKTVALPCSTKQQTEDYNYLITQLSDFHGHVNMVGISVSGSMVSAPSSGKMT